MALYSTIQNVGMKEDVSQVISNLTPTKTPFLSSIKSEKIKTTTPKWLEDSLRAVQVNAVAEGADAVDATLSPVVERTNATQILEKTIKVSGTLDAVDNHGREKESAYQVAKAGSELKRDLEHALVGTKQTMVTGATRQMAGVQAQIDATMKVKTGATGTAISEANLLAALKLAWNEGADVNTIMVTGDDAQTIAGFAQASGRYRTFESGSKGSSRIENVVDVYVAPWGGPCAVVSNRFLAAGDTLIYDADNFRKLTLRDWSRTTLALTGDNIKMQVLGEFSLKHTNIKASAIVRREA